MNRDLVEIRGWAEELAEDPALDGHPRMGDVLGTAAFAAYHHGDQDRADRRARAGLDRDPGSAYCLHAAAVLALSRGAYAEVIDLARRADAETNRRHLLGIVALAKANTGDVDGARTLIAQGLTGPLPPSVRAWITYFAGAIEHTAGRHELAERHYVQAIADGRASAVTFLVGVASASLLSVQATTGQEREALAGYPDVIDYFSRTGNQAHLQAALRDLAALLDRLGDPEPAALILAATAPTPPMAPTTAEVLDVARAAIARHLTST